MGCFDYPPPRPNTRYAKRNMSSGYAMDCPGWIRVTIGEKEQNEAFLDAMKAIRAGKVGQGAKARGPAVDATSLSPES